jgi:hypothetical protein
LKPRHWRSACRRSGPPRNPLDVVRALDALAGKPPDRILRGAKSGQLPVQAPTEFELVISLTTTADFTA